MGRGGKRVTVGGCVSKQHQPLRCQACAPDMEVRLGRSTIVQRTRANDNVTAWGTHGWQGSTVRGRVRSSPASRSKPRIGNCKVGQV